jgi:hypothetical protein
MILKKRQDTGNLKDEAPDLTMWTNRFESVKQTTE